MRSDPLEGLYEFIAFAVINEKHIFESVNFGEEVGTCGCTGPHLSE